LKEKYDLQIIIIFYFLYYLGLTFSTVSRIRITDLKDNPYLLKIKKGNIKKFKIISSIAKNICDFIKQKPNETLFLFYDDIKDCKSVTRVNFIRDKIKNVLKISKIPSSSKIRELMSIFSKTRAPKRLSEKMKKFFDMDIIISNDSISKELNLYDTNDKFREESKIALNCEISNFDNIPNLNSNDENIFNENSLFELSSFDKNDEDKELKNNVLESLDFINKRGYDFIKNEDNFLRKLENTQKIEIKDIISSYNTLNN
jgi:hypothetical protein